MTFEIRALLPGDVAAILKVDGGDWWLRDETYWADCLSEHDRGERLTVVAVDDDQLVAYAHLLWRSAYLHFQRRGIPEINNLRVAGARRKHGIGTAVIAHFEAQAGAAGCPAIGMGVGLYADYGPAQTLYAKLGYMPDGHGITFRNVDAVPGEMVRVDDDLLLWLVKRL